MFKFYLIVALLWGLVMLLGFLGACLVMLFKLLRWIITWLWIKSVDWRVSHAI